MNDEAKKLLNDEIVRLISNLSSMDEDSNEKTAAINNLSTLYELRIVENKNDNELKEKQEERELEKKRLNEEILSHSQEELLKKEQLSEQVKDRYFKLGIAAAELVIPLIFYGIWMRKGFKFEESGTYTSTTFRGLFNRFRPSKK